jgi:hypothetical protein
MRVLDRERWTDSWDEIGPWWQAYTGASPLVRGRASRVLSTDQPAESWDEVDAWWAVYSETGHDEAERIAELLERSSEEWAQSAGPFDTDPLAADLSLDRFSRGPLQPTNEMGWSRWLARLLGPSAALVTELFDVDVEQDPSEVVREDPISGRRPDILVFHTDRGISIEVKRGDPNYQKTAETAALVEGKYDDREWTHTLLLSKGNVGRLRSRVDAPVERQSDGRLRVEWTDPGPVSVLFWRDVTAAIRSLLRRGAVPDEHWAANAYLFCAVAEQRILGFQAQPVIERLTDPANVVETLRPVTLADTLEEQLTYLRARGET